MKRRRRRNPSLGDFQGLATLVMLGVAAYVIYKVFGYGKQAGAAVGQAFSTTSSKVADVLESVFPHALSNVKFTPNSWIVLPDGTEITSDLTSGAGAFTAADGSIQIQFYFGGKTYRVPATPDETNTYYATDTSGTTATPTTTPATLTPELQSFQDQINAMTAGG
jgi:hypothetical protein